MRQIFIIIGLIISLFSCMQKQEKSTSQTFIKGATLLNLQNERGDFYDIQNGYISFDNDKIIDLGELKENTIFPKNAKIIDATGKFILPGLIDGFAVLNSQFYANAFLKKGVTTIIGVDGGRRGWFYPNANPSPDFYMLESVGDEVKSDSAHLNDLKELHSEGYKIALLKYKLSPNQVKLIHNEAKKLGMGTIGELGYTSYAEGVEIGVDAFVHTTRYSLDVAPKNMRNAVAEEPFSNDLESAKWKYYKYLYSLDTTNQQLHNHAKTLASGTTFLMPTLSLLYADLPEHKNPWNDPVSKILNPADINSPVNRISGIHDYPVEIQNNYTSMAVQELKTESIYKRNGNRYLAGSATDVWGTMPGISLHTELELLEKIGLSKREILAAATSNFPEAFGWKTGKLKKGFEADILILDKNPMKSLENLNQIAFLFNNGKEINLDKLFEISYDETAENGDIVYEKLYEPFEDTAIQRLVFKLPNKSFKPEFSFLNKIEMKEIYYMSDGLRVKAYMAYPKNSKKLPAIIYNRGGNREFSKISPERVVDILARMASWGYVAIGTQYRGNDGGDGEEEFGGADVNDVLNLIPVLENLPQADAEKIGMLGKSRGGMMTYLSLLKTDKIKAAAVIGGVTDLKLMNDSRGGEMEKYVYQQLIPGYFENKDSLLHKRSAINRVNEISKTCPILIMHGTADWRVSPSESINMATAFQKEKIPYRLVMMEGEDHSLTTKKEEANQIIQDWFKRFLVENEKLPKLELHGK
jgi:dienelactone hydrolase